MGRPRSATSTREERSSLSKRSYSMPKAINDRQRTFDKKAHGGQSFYEPPSKDAGKLRDDYSGLYSVAKGRQYTVSEGHERSYDGKFREGGKFYTIRSEAFPSWVETTLKKGGANNNLEYRGLIGLNAPPPVITENEREAFRPYGTKDLDPYGADAVAICAPTNPNANVSTTIAETMREGIPSLPLVQSWKQRTNLVRGVASEFLNTTFGWLPLVSEVEAFRDSVRFHRTMLEQYQRDAGRNVRREFAFPIENTSETSTISRRAGFPGFSTSRWNAPTPGTLTVVKDTTIKRWFSGAFTYALPDDDSLGGMLRAGSEADKLFGISITPDVLWELTPWSWAADWFTNASSVIHNSYMFATGGLVMRYGYIMEEKTIKETYSLDRAALLGAESLAIPPAYTITTSKVRREANPFGFGLTGSDLSPLQELIAAAVGITKIL
jgi:hypothetical protein